MSSADILPCPFCGHEAKLHGPHADLGAWVSCAGCGLEGPTETGVTEAEAIAAWNRRPQPSPSSADKISDAEVEADRFCNATSAKEVQSAIDFLNEAARYFGKRPTGGEDAAFWSNVANEANCKRIAVLIADYRAALKAAAATRRAQSAVVGDGDKLAKRIAYELTMHKELRITLGQMAYIETAVLAALNATQEGK